MHARLTRPGILFAAIALLASACGSNATSPSASSAPSAEASASVAPPSTGPATVPPGGPVQIRWFCCLGGGDDPSQQKAFQQVIGDFNASHPNIKVVMDHTAYSGARDAFATRIASGNPPDIVGPLGVGGANAFEGQWLDLSPYIQKSNIDLTGFDQGVINLYQRGGQGQLGIPFAIYRSA